MEQPSRSLPLKQHLASKQSYLPFRLPAKKAFAQFLDYYSLRLGPVEDSMLVCAHDGQVVKRRDCLPGQFTQRLAVVALSEAFA
jgi:hypothetical protein